MFKGIRCILLLIILPVICQAQRIITADLGNTNGERNMAYQFCVGAGRANEGLRDTWRKQLKVVKSEIGFKYLRFHGLLHDDMGVYYEDKEGNPHYNWQYVDDLYDYMLSTGITPFVELSFMPKALASGDTTVFWWKGNITPPKDWKKWSNLVTALVKHFDERYGRKEVDKWYFEIWNEPNYGGFWSGTEAEYFKLYETSVRAIKSVSPTFKVGGPGSAGVGWINETLNYCKVHDVPLDFISTHSYNVEGVPIDEFGNKELKIKSNPNAIIDDIKEVKRKIQNSSFKNIELHITEWSSSYSANDPIHDTYENAPFVLHTLKQTQQYANSMSYWVFTDIFEEGSVPKTPFYGGFGLINIGNIKKPTFYAYKFLSELGKTELQNSDTSSVLACSEDKNNVQALFWDFTYPYHLMGKEIDNTYFKKLHPPKEKGRIKLSLNGLKNGKYKMQVYRIGYRNNDPFSTYYDMGLPNNITVQQRQQLEQASDGEPIENSMVAINNGKFEKSYEMKENDIVFIKLSKIQ